MHVDPVAATRGVLINLYRSLTISPGGSIQAMVSLDYECAWLEPICRRAIVSSPSEKLVDIEVIPADGQEYVGLALKEQLPWETISPAG
jgi:hypothetical protein